jgi:hypothetical protein
MNAADAVVCAFPPLRRIVLVWVFAVVSCGMALAETDLVDPAACAPGHLDYTFGWHPGFVGSPESGNVLSIATGHYGLVIDTARVALRHAGVLADMPAYEDAAAGLPERLATLPQAALRVEIERDGVTWTCVESAAAHFQWGRDDGFYYPVRLIESGRHMQRFDIQGLVFESPDGERLPQTGRLEVCAWPDRVAFVLDMRQNPLGSESVRVGGQNEASLRFGYGADLRRAHAPAFEPDALTLEAWVRPDFTKRSDDPRRWLIGKNGAEDQPGHFSLVVDTEKGKAMALVNTAGGMDALVTVDSADGTVREDTWHHLVMTLGGGVLTLYVDGEPAGRADGIASLAKGEGDVVVGRRPDNFAAVHFFGNIAHPRLHDAALGAEAVAANAAVGHEAVPGGNPVLHWERGASGEPPATLWMQLDIAGRTFSTEAPWDPEGLDLSAQGAALAVDMGGGEPREFAAGESAVTVRVTDLNDGTALPVIHDPVYGWHRVLLTGNTWRLEDEPDFTDRFRVEVENAGERAEPARLLFTRDHGYTGVVGTAPVVRGLDGTPAGIPVQISKNWHTFPGKSTLYEGQWLHNPLFLRVPAASASAFEYTLAYGSWGGVPPAAHAQLCLAGWGANGLWNQVAIGYYGEHICYDMTTIACAVQDVRPLLCYGDTERAQQKQWTNNVGGGDFLRLVHADGSVFVKNNTRTVHKSPAPNLTDVTFHSEYGPNGEIRAAMRVQTLRSDSLARHLHSMRYDVTGEVDWKQAGLYQAGSMQYGVNLDVGAVAWGDAGGLRQEWTDVRDRARPFTAEPFALDGEAPWVSLHDTVSMLGGKEEVLAANRGLVIRAWKARLGGKDAPVPWGVFWDVNQRENPHVVFELTPPPGTGKLVPGDFVEAVVELVIIPGAAEDYYGPDEALHGALRADAGTWRMVHREAAGNAVRAEVRHGTLGQEVPLRVRVGADQTAEVALTGGLGHVPVTFAGLTAPVGYRLMQAPPAGAPVEICPPGADWRQTDPEADGTWSMTFSLPLAEMAGGTGEAVVLRLEPTDMGNR